LLQACRGDGNHDPMKGASGTRNTSEDTKILLMGSYIISCEGHLALTWSLVSILSLGFKDCLPGLGLPCCPGRAAGCSMLQHL